MSAAAVAVPAAGAAAAALGSGLYSLFSIETGCKVLHDCGRKQSVLKEVVDLLLEYCCFTKIMGLDS